MCIRFSRFVRFLPSLTNWEIFFDLYEVFLRFFKKFRPPFRDKKAPITSQRCNRGRNRKSPLTEISGLKSYELIVCYRNLSAIAELGTHFWRKLGVNWRKLWRKHHNFETINRALSLPECGDQPSANGAFPRRFRDARRR